MLIWKLLAGECLQYVRKSTRKVEKNSHSKEDIVSHVQQNISMTVSMFLSLSHWALDILSTGKRDNHGGEYGQEISANFYHYGPKKIVKLTRR